MESQAHFVTDVLIPVKPKIKEDCKRKMISSANTNEIANMHKNSKFPVS